MGVLPTVVCRVWSRNIKNGCSIYIYIHIYIYIYDISSLRFNNFTTNEDIVTKFEADLPHCVRNVKVKNVLLFKFLCNIFIGVRIIKEMPGSVASETPCIIHLLKSSTCFEHYPAHLQEVYVVIVYMKPLVSSLSAGDCPVHRLRKNIFLNRCSSFLTGAQDSHLQTVTIPGAAYIQLRRKPPEDE